jgi:DNA-binding NarL/FixJ family response regulator
MRVLLADDTEIIRKAIRRLLSEDPKIELVGEASDFYETIAKTRELKPSVVVLDLHMPLGDGLSTGEVGAQLRACATKILGISVWNDEDTRSLALSLGVSRLLDKMNLTDELIPAILTVGSGQTEAKLGRVAQVGGAN